MKHLALILFVTLALLNGLSLSSGVAEAEALGGEGVISLFPVAVLQGVELGLLLMVWLAGPVFSRLPERHLSMPHKDFWLSEAQRPLARAKIDALVGRLGVTYLAFLLVATVVVRQLEASTEQPDLLPLWIAGGIAGVLSLWGLGQALTMFGARAVERAKARRPVADTAGTGSALEQD